MQHAAITTATGDLVRVSAYICNETDKAILVKKSRESRYPEWVPRSEITLNSRTVFNDAEITMPAWMAKKAGL